MRFETIINWNNEKEKEEIKSLYDSLIKEVNEGNQEPNYRLKFTCGAQIIAEYAFSLNDVNSVEALYCGKEVPKHLKHEAYESYYEIVFKIIEIEQRGELSNIKIGSNYGFSYHNFPASFELLPSTYSSNNSTIK